MFRILCVTLCCTVLDMACHVPLYRALLELLRAIAVCPPLMPLLLPLDGDDESSGSISSLLEKMKQCVDTYASRLKYALRSLCLTVSLSSIPFPSCVVIRVIDEGFPLIW